MVIIDPGHGGLDPGAVGNGLFEKDITLLIGSLVKNMLEGMYNIDAELTHINAGFGGVPFNLQKDLNGRAKKANELGAEYFVSIHADSFKNPEANGTTAYIIAPGGEAEKLAGNILRPLIRVLETKSRGVKTANFAVLRETKMPAVLIELAFISNKEDAHKLGNPHYLERASAGIAWGIASHINHLRAD